MIALTGVARRRGRGGMTLGRVLRVLCAAALAAGLLRGPARAVAAPEMAHRHFNTAIYITVRDVKRLADPTTFEREFNRARSQLRFDKVWIEAYRDRLFASDAELEAVKHQFALK